MEHLPSKVGDEITNPFQTFNGFTVEVISSHKLLSHSKTLKVSPLKFENGYVISPHIL